MNSKKTYPIALSIAGSDSSGGAGIQADIKTFSALGVYGASAITAITAQNTQGVHAQQAIDPQIVYQQIVAVVEDLHPSYAKIGMLANAEIVHAVAEALGRYPLTIILDPVIVSSTGSRLLTTEAQELIKTKLIPISTLVTPNIPEMEALSGITLTSRKAKDDAARRMIEWGARSILLKGGHEEGDLKTDILYTLSNGKIETSLFTSETITTRNIHGTGCTLSAAITALMTRGLPIAEAIAEAKRYISEAIRAGADVSIGHGLGPVNHGFNPLKMLIYETT